MYFEGLLIGAGAFFIIGILQEDYERQMESISISVSLKFANQLKIYQAY